MKDINFFKTKDSLNLKKVSSKKDIGKLDSCDGYYTVSNEKNARSILESLKGLGRKAIVALEGSDDAFNRRAVETLKIDYLVSPEGGKKFDRLKQRDSGINHVVAKLAKAKGISFVVNFSEISRLNPKEKALRLSRVIQNIKICRKAGCSIKVASFGYSEKDLVSEIGRKSFFSSLGASSLQTRDCCLF
ncbi:MAG: RNase P subunit p30 family protein [archaeon]|nr:hypothetical protein [Candidatus Dependentiae bacterium]